MTWKIQARHREQRTDRQTSRDRQGRQKQKGKAGGDAEDQNARKPHTHTHTHTRTYEMASERMINTPTLRLGVWKKETPRA